MNAITNNGAAISIGASARGFFDGVVSSATSLFSRILEHFFGPGIHRPVVGRVTWADLGASLAIILFTIIVNGAIAWLLRHLMKKDGDRQHWHFHLFGGMRGPVFLLIWIAGIYVSLWPILVKAVPGNVLALAESVQDEFFAAIGFLAVLWLCMRLTRGLEARLDLWAEKAPFRLAKFIAPLVGRALRVMIPLLAVIFVPPLFGLPAAYQSFFSTGSAILIIGAVACILFQAVNIFEKALLEQYDMTAADNLQARKIYTQARVISRTLHLAIAVCAVASVLMLFQEVRQIGASLLASAGIVGIVAGVAAQKTLANLIAGFQIALAQPIRLDDVVIAEGEWGRIEEISLTYVVVHIWDDRRLILPLVYFIEKPFQNWTRASAQLLGSVHVWVDYSLPLDEARRALKDIIESHPLWDKRFWNLQVTEATEKTMQLRVLATAGDSSRSWDLRCAIREQFIAFIQKNYPQCLPKIRAELPWREAAETGAMPVPP